MNPYVFVVGCPRSGTTLLRRLLDAHGELAIAPESHWIPQCYKRRLGVAADGSVTVELAEHLLADRRFAKLGLDPDDLAALIADGPSYAELVTRVLDAYGARQGKALVGDKTPGYAREIPTLHELWPHARFLHLIRDPRDVCLSALSWERKARSFERRFPTWRADALTTAALWWAWHVRLARRDGTALAAGSYFEARYESLVERPEKELRRICGFLGLDYDPKMLRFHEGRVRADTGLSAKRAWLPPTAGLRDWRTQMPHEDAAVVEAAVEATIDELGYDRSCTRPPRSASARAERIRDEFTRHLPPQREALPAAW